MSTVLIRSPEVKDDEQSERYGSMTALSASAEEKHLLVASLMTISAKD